MTTEYRVGQELWRHDINQDRRGGPVRVTVAKVGRKLVTVDVASGWSQTFRIDSGRANDNYQHAWLCTDEEHVEHTERSAALGRLRALHLRFDMGGYDRLYSPSTLNAVADMLAAARLPTDDGGAK